MDTAKIKKFAQFARRNLIDQVGNKLEQVLASDSPARRENPKAITDLESQIESSNQKQIIENVAYTWFNRFCALRFMDVNQYNRISVLSPVEGQFQPEILAEAKAGFIDESLMNAEQRDEVFNLLNGTSPSRDPQTEAYRKLIVAVCNDYHRIMPYLFQRIDDYTEVLMPDDLLSGNSILAYTRDAMTPEACKSVEVIGWLYQFYISEKKDEVFDGLKKNKKITPENIPAATQLFTPHWIVRYLVENSLGRLWMLNNQDSTVIEQMDYYIKPVEENQNDDYLNISSPEELKICDPACGSGHMLTYAYDLLYAIYLDAGFDSAEIPEKILTKNLYGIEIDERAAELAAFALTMKAVKGNPFDDSNNRRRFFRNPIKPNICRLENVSFSDDALDEYINFAGRDLFTQDLRATLIQFEEADNFGSLIQPDLNNVDDVRASLKAKDVSGQLFLAQTHQDVLKVLDQTDYLSAKYHVVIANPPYMGGKGMNGRLGKWVKDHYPNSKSDLFAVFIERNLKLAVQNAQVAMITMQSWMFLSSYEKFRTSLLNQKTINSMAHLGARAFDSIGGEVVSTTAFVLENAHQPEHKGDYLRLVDGKNETEKESAIKEAIQNPSCDWFYRASATDFKKIPGSPIAYWVSDRVLKVFETLRPLSDIAKPRQGLATSDNDRFLKQWHEIGFNNLGLAMPDKGAALASGKKWFPCQKGGPFRKWYGNNSFVVNWENDGEELLTYAGKLYGSPTRTIKNIPFYFKEGITWSTISSSALSMRYSPVGFISETKGAVCFSENRQQLFSLLGFANSHLINYFLQALSPTLDYHEGPVGKLPVLNESPEIAQFTARSCVDIAIADWNSHEKSWDFKKSPLLTVNEDKKSLLESYTSLRRKWIHNIDKMKELEKENNRIFIDAYELQDELTPEVPLKEITLTCNPHYRYGEDKTEVELEALLLADTIREFISYAVGCMLGRYSLDKEGLILANQGETLADYLQQIPEPQFKPDDDNVIPLINFEGDWFEDDISERFKVFLKTTFGEQHYDENLSFIEQAIGKNIKKFFISEFYTDHIKRYKKRPIYWLFSSPKGSFNALIYLHRYRPDTVSIVLNDYLREFSTKLSGRKDNLEQITISASASQKEKTQALKTIEKINKVLDEINEYEHDVLYPLATRQIEIDLDDGVKHNYPLFGKALKKVTGLS